MGRRPGRTAAKNANAALKNTPQALDDDEDQLLDVDSGAASPPQMGDENEGLEEDEEDDEEGQGFDIEGGDAADEKPIIRKKRLGRPPKNKPPGWDDGDGPTHSAAGTPRSRGRGRGGFRGGGRWNKNRGGPSHVTQQPVDKEGNMMDVVDDEVALPEDEEGEKKITKMGHLLGDREYRCRTFTILGRGERLYMLSTEPARCVGFRDSYLFFAKHKRLFKIIIDDEEKRDLIERQIIPHSYKGRAIGVCTARSVFREFGAQIVVGGKRITDEYEVKQAREQGHIEGELADPADNFKSKEDYNKNQYVAWHGASSVYHSGQPSVPVPGIRVPEGKKRRVAINDINWMYEHAQAASNFNSKLAARRRTNNKGVYDVHTNTMQYPRDMQPSHAKFIQINDYEVEDEIKKLRAEGIDATHDKIAGIMFPPVDPALSRNYLIIDTVMERPPSFHYDTPGPEGVGIDLSFNGLSSIPPDQMPDMTPECRASFDKAVKNELAWKAKFGTESTDGHRRDPRIDKGVITL
ncbi:chromatin remodelling complex Rsc7/Swp82 subunit-domain-containing protein [Calycina marina]|uniref:Chromatin remodelling complex Rsc7/Swp82 subunit-domain-containing protein n=1 Tax=Calycina marina TaxID=1763456 RepID=A0A9P7YXN4_9HELO|nr:chromatin remodelling complex Rsc7/Swp82 subunit-domain-containing protein [Calycina marina]